jgi:hypothetical protein
MLSNPRNPPWNTLLPSAREKVAENVSANLICSEAKTKGAYLRLSCSLKSQAKGKPELECYSNLLQTFRERWHMKGRLAHTPPSEIQKELLKNALQKDSVSMAMHRLPDLVNSERGPGVHRRVDVRKVPL